jgi:hypothetical protein
VKRLPIYLSLLFLLTCAKEDSQAPNNTPSNITPRYTLTASAGEGGSVSPTTGSFNSGTQVSVTATPNSGYQFTSWSNGSTVNPVTVTLNSNTSITANFEVLINSYTLTVVSTDGGSATGAGEYNEGTEVTLTATASDGYRFTGWSDGSTEESITITLSENRTIEALFEMIPVDIPAIINLSTKSKLFTINSLDTLKIPINIPNGFKSFNISAEYGNVNVQSLPNENDLEGEVIINYSTSIIKNVDWDRTIAGKDNISIEIIDQNDYLTSFNYSIRVQPEPIFRNYNKPHGAYLHGNSSRARVNLELVEHLNRRSNIEFKSYCGDGSYPYEVFTGSTIDDMEAGKVYLGADFLDRYPGSTYGNILYPDLNGDGYEDLVFTRISNIGNCYGCEALPIEFYLYEDGEYKYHQFSFSGQSEVKVKMGSWVIIADLDNDNDPDIIVQGVPDAVGSDQPGNEILFLENRLNQFNDFKIHEFNPFQFTTQNFPVDMNMDGLLDIVSASGPHVYINKGNFEFESLYDSYENSIDFFGYQNPDLMNDFNTGGLYFDFNSSQIIDDFDGDGVIDIYLPGLEGGYQNKVEAGEFPYLPNIPEGKIIFGEVEERYVHELEGNSDVVRFKYENIVGIPEVSAYNEQYTAQFKDIDFDGNKELVIARQKHTGTYPNNRQEGHFIQILKINQREIIDVTSQFINENYASDDGVIFGGCSFDNRLRNGIRVDDTDNDGLMEIFSTKAGLLDFNSKNHIWEWNGSKFIKTE